MALMQITFYYDQNDPQVVTCDHFKPMRLDNGTVVVNCTVGEDYDTVAWANVSNVIHMEVSYDIN